jgi:non-specific serine/threonine protein kinase
VNAVEENGPGNPPDRLEINIQDRELRINGSAVQIGSRAFAVLQTLVEASGATVSKSDLISRAWTKTAVGDTALQVQISAIRTALDLNRMLLKTISGQGYRLLGDWDVRQPSGTADPTHSQPLRPDPNSARPPQEIAAGHWTIYRSDGCEIDLSLRQVRIHGNTVPIGGRAFDILTVLVQAANEIVTRGTLLELVWSGVIVGETARRSVRTAPC